MNNMLSAIKVVLLSALSVHFLAACGSAGVNDDRVIVNQKKYEDSTGDCDSTYSNNCAQIKIELPHIEYSNDKEAERRINKQIQNHILKPVFDDSPPESVEKLIRNFLQEYETFKADFPEAFQHWSLERIGTVRHNSSYIFSVEFAEYSYLGGAHPNAYVTFTNYDLKTGEEIHLRDLFKSNFEIELNQIAESEFRRLKELTESEDLGQAGFWFDNNKFSLNDNLLITDSSLIFYYNNYEITAYAFGPTELEITYDKIKHLVEPEGVISALISKL
jgi:hypothetical protein